MKKNYIPRLFLHLILISSFAVSVSAKDEWLQVRSKNFFLIGNASEKDIRKVGTRLEQFRETFRLIFGKMNLTSPVPTNVIVFKSDSYYKTFKPKRADGKIDNFVAGFFQPGDDVNYITLSTEGEEAETYSTIFHEYVHFIVNTNFGKSEVPAWFNEGLAEYYSTFEIEADQKVRLGLLQQQHIPLLQQSKLIPLSTLFGISNSQLLQTGNHSRSIFYAQSWALIHYLIQGGKSEGLGKFLAALLRNVPPEKAFQDAFQIGYAQMEKDLQKYVGKSSYQYQQITLNNKLLFENDMIVSPLGEVGSNAYLGDLLFHTNRGDDAESYLLTALKLQPDSSMANTTLGMVKLRQRKFDQAKIYLEKAIATDQKNHAAFYNYALLLSREGRDEFGYVQKFDKETAARMRDALRKAIAINPAFTESYELLAFVDLVNTEELDDAVAQMQKALKYQPGNQRYSLRIAEIYMQQSKFSEAGPIAEKVSRTADDPGIKSRADGITSQIIQRKAIEESNAAEIKRYETRIATGNKPPRLIRRIEGGKEPTETEKAKMLEDATLRSMNDALRTLATGEQRVVAKIQKIDCKKRPIIYTVSTANETFTLTSMDFTNLELTAMDPDAANVQIGCDVNLSSHNALVTYKVVSNPKSTSRGELVAIDFVPANFRVMSEEEMSSAELVIYDQNESGNSVSSPVNPLATRPTTADLDSQRRALIMQSMRDALQKPGEGEKQEIGYLDKIECTEKASYFYLRTPTGIIKLLNVQTRPPRLVFYTPDLNGVQLGCGIKPIEFPAVFIYAVKPDKKAKTAGEILSVEFMPNSFTLEPNP